MNADSDLIRLVNDRIEARRPRLLDTSRRNPRGNNVLTARTASYVSIVDEKPDNIAQDLDSGSVMFIQPLPLMDEDNLPDEKTPEFKAAFEAAKQIDEKYLSDINEIDFDLDERAFEKEVSVERQLTSRLTL